MKFVITLVLGIGFYCGGFAQTQGGLPAGDNNALPSVQNLYFVKQGIQPVFGEKDYQPNQNGFYIYRNCIYNLVLKNKLQIAARVIDIRNDSIYFTRYIDEKVAQKYNAINNLIAIHPSAIRRIKLIGDRIMGIYNSSQLNEFEYVFETAAEPKQFSKHIDTVFAKDSSHSTVYEVVPYLTSQGLDMVYEQCGETYYYRGYVAPLCEDTAKKVYQVRKGVWFTPSNANEIRGVNVGLITMQMDDKPLKIHGVNLNADFLSMLLGAVAIAYVPFDNALINMTEPVDTMESKTSIRGLSISAGGVVGDNDVKGVSINGVIHSSFSSNGLVISGTQNLVDEFKGVIVGGLRNRSVKGSGLQIGLLNICKNLKGFQIGLWNVNSKRKLPFINWSF